MYQTGHKFRKEAAELFTMVEMAKTFAASLPHSNEQHTDMECLADHGYSGIDDDNKVDHCHDGVLSCSHCHKEGL